MSDVRAILVPKHCTTKGRVVYKYRSKNFTVRDIERVVNRAKERPLRNLEELLTVARVTIDLLLWPVAFALTIQHEIEVEQTYARILLGAARAIVDTHPGELGSVAGELIDLIEDFVPREVA